MLEKLNTPGHELISRPNQVLLAQLRDVMQCNPEPVVAEVGTGVGATSLEIAKLLGNRGELHLYDFVGRAGGIAEDLAKMGYTNVRAFENTRKHWDSYNWSLMQQVINNGPDTYDLAFLDGAHTFHHDALAFVLLDRLLKTGGIIQFDDFNWRYADSEALRDVRDTLMTKEQIESKQVALIIRTLVDTDERYECIVGEKVWRKNAPHDPRFPRSEPLDQDVSLRHMLS